MKKGKTAFGAFAFLLVAGSIWFLAHRGKRESATVRQHGGSAFHLVYARPERRDFQVTLPWTGRVESMHCVRLIALAAGRVLSIDAADETPVASGAPLLEIGGPMIGTARKALAAAVQSAAARLKTARETLKRKQQGLKAAGKTLAARTQALTAQLALAKQTAAARGRALDQHLGTTEQVAAAQADVDRLTAELSAARLQEAQLPAADALASAEQQVPTLESVLAAARAKLDDLDARTHVGAPFDGVFTARRVHVGQSVRSGDVLGTVLNPRCLRVVARLFPPAGVALVEGMKAEIRLPNSDRFSAVVERVMARATPAAAATLWLAGPELNRRLRPGAAVSGRLVLTERTRALAVPRAAVVYDTAEMPFVFVRQADGCRKVRVRTGVEQGAWIEIREGLGENQSVVVQGAYELLYATFSQSYKVVD